MSWARCALIYVHLWTIVNHWSSKSEKPLKNHRCQWLSRYHSINGDGENFQKPSPFHRWRKKTITIPLPWKIDHRSGLRSSLVVYKVLIGTTFTPWDGTQVARDVFSSGNFPKSAAALKNPEGTQDNKILQGSIFHHQSWGKPLQKNWERWEGCAQFTNFLQSN